MPRDMSKQHRQRRYNCASKFLVRMTTTYPALPIEQRKKLAAILLPEWQTVLTGSTDTDAA